MTNRGIADMIKSLQPHYPIFTARDGEEALHIVLDNRMDIIFTDIRMPDMDGLTMIEQLRKHSESLLHFALEKGLGFVFAAHLAPQLAIPVLRAYRSKFKLRPI